MVNLCSTCFCCFLHMIDIPYIYNILYNIASYFREGKVLPKHHIVSKSYLSPLSSFVGLPCCFVAKLNTIELLISPDWIEFANAPLIKDGN